MVGLVGFIIKYVFINMSWRAEAAMKTAQSAGLSGGPKPQASGPKLSTGEKAAIAVGVLATGLLGTYVNAGVSAGLSQIPKAATITGVAAPPEEMVTYTTKFGNVLTAPKVGYGNMDAIKKLGGLSKFAHLSPDELAKLPSYLFI